MGQVIIRKCATAAHRIHEGTFTDKALSLLDTAFTEVALTGEWDTGFSHSAALGRAAAVMRHRRNVADAANIDTGSSASARDTDSRPEPGPETRTSTERTPWSRAALAALTAACCAANGGALTRTAETERDPEDFHDSVLPCWSVMVTMVLLNVAWMKTSPNGTFLRSRFLNFLFLPTLAAPAVLFLSLCHGLLGHFTSYRQLFSYEDLYGASVGVGALAADRKRPAVTETTIGLNFDQALDVERDFLAEIALDAAPRLR